MKACIFDLDGTLTSTLDSLEYSTNATMREIGMPEITKDQCRRFVGNGARVLIESALKAGGDEQLLHLEEAMKTYARIFEENCTYHVEPYEGIVRMLQSMKGAGIALAVLSNKPDQQAVKVVREVFGEGVFDLVQGQKEGVPRKPDPTAALEMAKELGADASETAYIGDSEVDLETGIAAGMKTILVSWGFRGRAALEEDGADCIVDSVDEILDIVKE